MAFLVGTDEAGYGPNLGPLVVSATVWQVPSAQIDLFASLRNSICRPCDSEDEAKLVIGDSKELYKPGKGLAGLERGVLTCLASLEKRPRTWRQIWNHLAAREDSKTISKIPWYQNFKQQIPVELTSQEIRDAADSFVVSCQSAGCSLIDMRSRVVCPPVFNTLCDRHGNKASALSHTTLELVRTLLSELPSDEPVFVLSDKHGGRNKYAALLQDIFPDDWVKIHGEGRRESVYELGSKECSRRFVFRAKADESFLPSALASMVSKYLRELAMRAFNAFWVSRIADLKPTAGYPVDAKRFKRDIEKHQRKLGIDDNLLWRRR